MVHNCVDWSANPPSRKAPFLVFTYDDRHWYVTVPRTFAALEELARTKFDLGTANLEFHSSCVNLCSSALARIDQDVWEHVAPYIGCVTVTQKQPPTKFVAELRCDDTDALLEEMPAFSEDQTLSSVSEATEYGDRARDGGPSISHKTQTRAHSVSASQSSAFPEEAAHAGMHHAEEVRGSVHDGPQDDVPPLPKSPNRWVAPSLDPHGHTDKALYSPDRAKSVFTGLLNKLTRKNVGFIFDRMIAWISKCDSAVQGRVLKLAIRLIFDRAVDEPERTGTYASLLETIAAGVRSPCGDRIFELAGYEAARLINQCLTECKTKALQQKCLSWGVPIRRSLVTGENSVLPADAYYAAEKGKRRGIGLASLIVELSRSKLLTLSNYASDESLFQELHRNLSSDPNEGDIVSLGILIPNVDVPANYWSGNRNRDKYRRECLTYCISLTKHDANNIELSPRLRCRLLELADLCHESDRRFITYYFPHDGSRYSIPDSSRLCARKFSDASNPDAFNKCITLVDSGDHAWLIRSVAVIALEQKASTMGRLLARAWEGGLCSPEDLEAGFRAAANVLDVAEKNNHKAYNVFAQFLKDVGFDKEEERTVRIAREVKNAEKLIQLTLW